MRKILLSMMMAACAMNVAAQKQDDDPANRFAVTVSVDSAIANTPQKVYLVSRMEGDFQLHDSLAIDSTHRRGTMHGQVPYEYNVNLMFARRGPGVVPLVVKNGDSLHIHIGDEDDGFRMRLIDKVEGSPSTLELIYRNHLNDSIREEQRKIRGEMELYDISDEKRDSLMKIYNALTEQRHWRLYNYAMTGSSPYNVVDEAASVLSGAKYRNRSWNDSPFTMDDADRMMNHLIKKFPDYPPMIALANDSTLGRNYLSARSFEIYSNELRRWSSRFFDEAEDSTLCPLKVGDYMNIYFGYQNINQYRGKYMLVDFWASWCGPCIVQMPNIKLMAQIFPDDVKVILVSMDKTSKEWWQAVKKYDLRNKKPGETDKPYELSHIRAYDDKTGKMYPGVKKLGIKAIPHNYLVDREGRIIAKNISIPLAIDRIKSLLEKEKQQ